MGLVDKGMTSSLVRCVDLDTGIFLHEEDEMKLLEKSAGDVIASIGYSLSSKRVVDHHLVASVCSHRTPSYPASPTQNTSKSVTAQDAMNWRASHSISLRVKPPILVLTNLTAGLDHLGARFSPKD